jgi:hypothetical protein
MFLTLQIRMVDLKYAIDSSGASSDVRGIVFATGHRLGFLSGINDDDDSLHGTYISRTYDTQPPPF